MAYELKHKNNTINPTLESGRYRYAFSPETPYEELKFIHDGQIGDWHFDQVMLNQGAFEQYEENANTESMLGATFRHINELQTYVTDENGDMTRMVREGMRSSYRIFQDIQEGTSSETLDSDNGLYRLIKDTQTNSMGEFIQTSDLFASRIGELSTGVTGENLISGNMETQILNPNYNWWHRTLEPMIDGQNYLIRIEADTNSHIETFKIGNPDVRFIEAGIGIYEAIVKYQQDPEYEIDRVYVTNKGSEPINFRYASVYKVNEGTYSQISQVKNMIELAFFGSAGDQISRLAVGELGIYLNGALIDLDGNAKFNDVFAQNVWARGITASNVTAMSAQFGHAIINNLDVNSATVNKASFIEALFNGVRSRVRIHSGGMDVMRNNGTYSSRFHDNGIDIYRDADWVGSVRSLNAVDTTGFYAGKKSMSLSTRPNAYLSLSYWSPQDDTYYRALGLGGDGRLRVHSPLYAGNTDYGLSIYRSNVSGRPALKLHASNGGGGIFIEPNREVSISLTNGNYLSFQTFYDDYLSLKRRVANMDGGSSSGGGGSSPTITYHTTTAGQYPYLIAEMYGITLEQLFAWNTWYTPGSVVKVGDQWRVS